MNAGLTNHGAKNEAKASIFKELYHDYNLNSLLDEYPETRVRFYDDLFEGLWR